MYNDSFFFSLTENIFAIHKMLVDGIAWSLSTPNSDAGPQWKFIWNQF